jgi:hypothetical protein
MLVAFFISFCVRFQLTDKSYNTPPSHGSATSRNQAILQSVFLTLAESSYSNPKQSRYRWKRREMECVMRRDDRAGGLALIL